MNHLRTFQMRRIGDHGDLGVALRLSVKALDAHAQMVFHVAAAFVGRLQRAELRQNCRQRLTTHIRQHVQTTAERQS
jgi:hypothetical protein